MTSPTLKTCCACQQALPLDLFAFKDKASGRLQSRCKACKRAYNQKHYEDRKEYYIDKASLNRQTVDARNRAYVAELLTKEQCSCCSASQDLHYVLHGTQGQPVHQAVHCGLSLRRIQEAVARSKVFCGACLRAHTTEALLREWGHLSQAERTLKQALRAMGSLPTPDPGRFKNYRAADACLSGATANTGSKTTTDTAADTAHALA